MPEMISPLSNFTRESLLKTALLRTSPTQKSVSSQVHFSLEEAKAFS